MLKGCMTFCWEAILQLHMLQFAWIEGYFWIITEFVPFSHSWLVHYLLDWRFRCLNDWLSSLGSYYHLLQMNQFHDSAGQLWTCFYLVPIWWRDHTLEELIEFVVTSSEICRFTFLRCFLTVYDQLWSQSSVRIYTDDIFELQTVFLKLLSQLERISFQLESELSKRIELAYFLIEGLLPSRNQRHHTGSLSPWIHQNIVTITGYQWCSSNHERIIDVIHSNSMSHTSSQVHADGLLFLKGLVWIVRGNLPYRGMISIVLHFWVLASCWLLQLYQDRFQFLLSSKRDPCIWSWTIWTGFSVNLAWCSLLLGVEITFEFSHHGLVQLLLLSPLVRILGCHRWILSHHPDQREHHSFSSSTPHWRKIYRMVIFSSGTFRMGNWRWCSNYSFLLAEFAKSHFEHQMKKIL